MSFDDAVSALGDAIEADNGVTPAPAEATPAPAPEASAQQATESATPEGSTDPGAAPAEPVDTPSLYEGTSVNPDELIRSNPELEPLVKQLQAVFTQKTQGVAETRRSLEALGDLEQIQEAVESYQWIQDPANWPTLHENLTQQMQEMGLSRAEAEQAASTQLGAGESTPDLSQYSQDPELSPLAQQMQTMQAQLDSFRQEQAEREAAYRVEQQQMAMIGEIQRQEQLIRDANPAYSQEDIDAIYELSSFFEGNLLEAQGRYQQITGSILERHLETKTAAAMNPATQPLTSGEVSHEAPEAVSDDLEAAHERALQRLAEVESIDFT